MPHQTPSATKLIPIDAQDGAEQELLHKQRVICGWKIEKVPVMLKEMRDGKRIFFWIGIPSEHEAYVSTDGEKSVTYDEASKEPNYFIKMPLLKQRSVSDLKTSMLDKSRAADHVPSEDDQQQLLPVGHISIDISDTDSNPSPLLGSQDGSTMILTTLFVLPCYRHLGLGSWTMRECEQLIRSKIVIPPVPGVQCHAISLSTLSDRHYLMEGPEGKGKWELCGLRMEDNKYQGPWYEKLGYQKYYQMPKWPPDVRGGLPNSDLKSTMDLWWAEFWKKEL